MLKPVGKQWEEYSKCNKKHAYNSKYRNFHHNNTITWNVHVDEHTMPADAQYDMIMPYRARNTL